MSHLKIAVFWREFFKNMDGAKIGNATISSDLYIEIINFDDIFSKRNFRVLRIFVMHFSFPRKPCKPVTIDFNCCYYIE